MLVRAAFFVALLQLGGPSTSRSPETDTRSSTLTRRCFVAGTAGITIPAVRAQTKTKLSYGHSAATDFVTVVVAAEQGMFARRGVEIDVNGSQIVPSDIGMRASGFTRGASSLDHARHSTTRYPPQAPARAAASRPNRLTRLAPRREWQPDGRPAGDRSRRSGPWIAFPFCGPGTDAFGSAPSAL